MPKLRLVKTHKTIVPELERGTQTPSIVGTGLVALDVVYGEHKNPLVSTGGTCGNVLCVLAFLGWEAVPLARHGSTDVSEKIAKDLARWGVKTDYLSLTPTAPPPVIVQKIKRSPAGVPYHTFSWVCPGCNARLPGYRPVTRHSFDYVSTNLVAPTVFFFDRVSPFALQLARHYSENGCLVFFEPSASATQKEFAEAIKVSHVLKYSNERAAAELGGIQRDHLLLEVETLGAGGLRYRSPGSKLNQKKWKTLAAFPVKGLKDTAGAGDWCTAGIIQALCKQGRRSLGQISTQRLEDGLHVGQALSAWTCRFEGARGGMYVSAKSDFMEEIHNILSGSDYSDRIRANGAVTAVGEQFCWAHGVKPHKARTVKSRR